MADLALVPAPLWLVLRDCLADLFSNDTDLKQQIEDTDKWIEIKKDAAAQFARENQQTPEFSFAIPPKEVLSKQLGYLFPDPPFSFNIVSHSLIKGGSWLKSSGRLRT